MGVVRGTYRDSEVQFIINNHDKMSIAEMAKKLNRTYMSVAHKRRELGLSPEPTRSKDDKILGGFKKSKVDKYRKQFEVGKTYHVKPIKTVEELTENYNSDYDREFVGQLVKKTNDLLVFDKGPFKECIKLVDVVRNAYEIEEVE